MPEMKRSRTSRRVGCTHIEEMVREGTFHAVCLNGMTGKISRFAITPDQAKRVGLWAAKGSLIQDALPDLPSERREQLISGVTPEEWAEIFGGDE